MNSEALGIASGSTDFCRVSEDDVHCDCGSDRKFRLGFRCGGAVKILNCTDTHILECFLFSF